MSDQRKDGIAWTKTWNPLRGCSKVSTGCKNCYAETMAARFAGPGQPYEGTIDRGRWSGQIRIVPEKLGEPLRWRHPRRVFVNSMSDLFHENVPFEFIAAVFGVMAAAPQHVFQVLTKRPERAAEFFRWLSTADVPYSSLPAYPNHVRQRSVCCRYAWSLPSHVWPRVSECIGLHPDDAVLGAQSGPWPLPNVWLGVSVEDQSTADARIPHLLACPAEVRWVSYEPALGPVDFSHWLNTPTPEALALDWIVIGGESGPHARPFDVAWARSALRDSRAAGVACFVKQLGARPRVAEASRLAALWAAMPGGRVDDCGGIHLRDRAGADPAEWPEDLRVREWPAAKEGEK